MCGIIWYVQAVQYPSFKNLSERRFIEIHRHHVKRTGFVVIPPMLTEFLTSALLLYYNTPVDFINMAGLSVVIAIWVSTFLIQLPIHQKLQLGYNDKLVNRLIRTNWLRTGLWSLKVILFLYGGYLLLRG